ncbi:MAG: hypothetical protein ACM3NR_02030 [Methanosarcina sp.]
MLTKKIKDRTIKDIFETLLGEDNAKVFLSKVQAQYDKGLRGEELEKYARQLFGEYKIVEPGSVKIAVAVIAVVVI